MVLRKFGKTLMIKGNKLRLLMVNTVPTERNGITNVIINLISAMNQNKIEIGYVAINNPEQSIKNDFKKLGIKLYILPRKISSPFRYIRQFAGVAKTYDVIHVHGNSATMSLEMIAAKLGHVPLRIAHSHSSSCVMKSIDKLFRPIFYKLCNGRLACGKKAGEWLYRNRDYIVINNGIDTEKFRYNENNRAEIRERLNIKDNIVIGHVGNFDPVKNHPFIFDVFKELLSLNNKARLMLVGGGSKFDEYTQLTKDLNIYDKVIFTGNVSNPNDYMSAMDLIIMPSIFEGFPLTLVEEQANGLRCIVSDAITNEVNISGNVHFLSLNKSTNEWAHYINNVLTTTYDRISLSNEAISSINSSEYSIKVIADRLLQYYFDKLQN